MRRVVQQADECGPPSAYVFVADVEPAAADRLVEAIAELGIGVDDYVLTRSRSSPPSTATTAATAASTASPGSR